MTPPSFDFWRPSVDRTNEATGQVQPTPAREPEMTSNALKLRSPYEAHRRPWSDHPRACPAPRTLRHQWTLRRTPAAAAMRRNELRSGKTRLLITKGFGKCRLIDSVVEALLGYMSKCRNVEDGRRGMIGQESEAFHPRIVPLASSPTDGNCVWRCVKRPLPIPALLRVVSLAGPTFSEIQLAARCHAVIFVQQCTRFPTTKQTSSCTIFSTCILSP